MVLVFLDTVTSDERLDEMVRSFQHRSPHLGRSITEGMLKSRGIVVPRYRICESIRRVDPVSCRFQWNQLIRRRVYAVPGPNALWHVDGNHRLIRWRLVVHGAIDGYSRMITYLLCSTNNKSKTVLKLFEEAVRQYGCPSRVRSDKGGENEGICMFMLRFRETGRNSHISGSSTHNQRIERLWRDVYSCVISTFHSLFYYLEQYHGLDPLSDFDLFVLHTVFLPRINHCLLEFTNSWNNHNAK